MLAAAGPECKAALLPLLLDSILKWYPTDKIFKARVHTKAQAAMLLAKMRELYPASTDLPLTLEAAGEWNPACVKEVAVVPTECVVAKSGIEVGKVILNDGNLYPLREPIKSLGFTFVKDFTPRARTFGWRPLTRSTSPRSPPCTRSGAGTRRSTTAPSKRGPRSTRPT